MHPKETNISAQRLEYPLKQLTTGTASYSHSSHPSSLFFKVWSGLLAILTLDVWHSNLLLSTDSLTRVLATGQERRSKPESSAAKLYCLHLQEQECKRARALLLTSLGARAQESKRARALLLTSSGARERMVKPRPF